MDPLNWVLICWLGIAGFVFFVLQKFLETSYTGNTIPTEESLLPRRRTPSVTSSTFSRKSDNPQRQVSVNSVSSSQVFPEGKGSNGLGSNWLNELVAWAVQHYQGQPQLVQLWLRSLNDSAKKVANLTGCEILFEELVENAADPPKFSEITTSPGPRDHMTIRCCIDFPKLTLRLVSSQRLPEKLVVSNYDALLTDLRGAVQLRVACIANEFIVMSCLDGRPELNIALTPSDGVLSEDQVDLALVEDTIRRSLVSAVTNFSFKHYGPCPEDSPVPMPALSPSDYAQPAEEVMKRLQALPHQQSSVSRAVGDKLLITVLRSQKLRGENGPAVKPFVIIELDEPNQKHTTSLSQGPDPFWTEQFLFEVGGRSEEILFEVYDKREEGDNVFMGLAIVGIEELRLTNISTHTLLLQSRPYRNDPVSGSLVAEFLFADMEQADEIGKQISVNREPVMNGVVTDTRVTSVRPLLPEGMDMYSGDLKAVPTKTTSVLVKSVSQYFQTVAAENSRQNNLMIADDTNFRKDDFPEVTKSPSSPVVGIHQKSKKKAESELESLPPTSQSSYAIGDGSSFKTTSIPYSMDRGRSKDKRSKDFFSDMKSRLSFKGKQSKRAVSLDVDKMSDSDTFHQGARSLSSVPNSRDTSASRFSGLRDGNLSRAEESSESIYEQSTLVAEVSQNNNKRYYLIPPAMFKNPRAKRLMKRGTKLHIFNEHTYVAVHSKSGTNCNICTRRIRRSLGKQAYQCRDCRLICHKRCHFKSDAHCLNSNVSRLEIEYVWTETKQ